MRPTKTKAHGPSLRALTTALALALLAALLLAGAASAAIPEGSAKSAAKPGTPTAKAPVGTIAATMPTFKWSRAVGAAQYKLSVYEGSTLLFSKGGLSGLAWKSTKTLPQNVTLTWKVRAQSAGGLSAWSGSLSFKIATASQAKAITGFTVPGQTGATVIDEAAKTVALTVPSGTTVTALVASFTTSGASVRVGATTQVSGTTANNFTSPVTYTVTAADATTQEYVVTVTPGAPALAIGQPCGGGIVAYIVQPGDAGYVAGQTHGFIAAAADQTAYEGYGIQWATEPYWYISVPGTGTALGTGSASTTKIIAQNRAGATYAAGLARAYTGGGYSDWYLPSKNELNKLYLNRVAIGGFDTTDYDCYWSSSEFVSSPVNAWGQRFRDGFQDDGYGKYGTVRVRAVRAF